MNIIRRSQGESLSVLGDRVTIKVPSACSPFSMSVVEVEVPPGSGTPTVTHAREEELYLICEGELTMHGSDGTHRLQAGDIVHVPPRTAHGYRNESGQRVRFIAWSVGGPLDGFFRDMAQSVHRFPEDLPAMQAVMQRYGVRRAREVGPCDPA